MFGIKFPKPDLKRLAQDKKEDRFFDLLAKLHTTDDRVKKHYMIKEATKLAKEIPYLKGWPEKPIFWDIEADMWKINIQKEVREFIKE